jgi:16S rRNA (cytosine1402-N4)-methyltransferase
VQSVDGVLIDAGVSSMQLDDPARGFSFQEEGPLDMRMDPTQGPDAAEFLASVEEDELARLLRLYGDVGPARRIAAAIVRRSRTGNLNSTRALAEAVGEALPHVRGVPEETRTVFQSIRMAVNGELLALEAGLKQAMECLAPQGRLVVISFHSGEDRLVKNLLRDASRLRRERHPDGRTARTLPATMRLLTRKPVTPSADECARNPRSQSARLRAAERLAPEEVAA